MLSTDMILDNDRGNPTVTETNKRDGIMSEKKIYHQSDITITDSMFIDRTGDQYPLRNITSVKVRCKIPKQVANVLKFVGFGLTALGIVMVVTIGTDGLSVVVIGLAALLAWFTNKVYIELGSGGIKQETYSAPARNPKNWEGAQQVAQAINEAISDMQGR